jgi:hypothetical protein
MNAADADDALTEAIGARDFAARMLERAQNSAHVATQNLGFAERHLAAMDEWVAQRERVLRELTIADDGGYHPTETDA